MVDSMENDMTYEKAFAMLSDIVDKMDDASCPLDELVKLYEEGMKLSAYCESLLKSYNARLETITERTKKAVSSEDIDR